MAIEIGGKMYVTVAERLQAVHAENDRFEDFVATPPLAGLGTDIDLIRRIVKDDSVTLDKLDEALQRPKGRPENLNNVKICSETEYPQGNSKDRALRHLREKRPDLHSRVLTGELSPHAAMREAGFRRPRGNRKSEQSKEEIKSNNVTLDRGNSESYALEILQNKRPDLLERVKVGELSPHAAMREAGFRRPTMTGKRLYAHVQYGRPAWPVADSTTV